MSPKILFVASSRFSVSLIKPPGKANWPNYGSQFLLYNRTFNPEELNPKITQSIERLEMKFIGGY